MVRLELPSDLDMVDLAEVVSARLLGSIRWRTAMSRTMASRSGNQ